MRYLLKRSRAWRSVSCGLTVITDLVIQWETSMANVLLSVRPLPFDRQKLGIGPLIRGMSLIGAFEGTADALGQFLVGRGDDECPFGFGDLDDAFQRIDSLGAFFLVVDQAQDFVFMRSQKRTRLQGHLSFGIAVA